jgi:hypothetical protein
LGSWDSSAEWAEFERTDFESGGIRGHAINWSNWFAFCLEEHDIHVEMKGDLLLFETSSISQQNINWMLWFLSFLNFCISQQNKRNGVNSLLSHVKDISSLTDRPQRPIENIWSSSNHICCD